MSQRARTVENFPRMKVRGARRRHFKRQAQQWDLLMELPRYLEQMADAFAGAVDEMLRKFAAVQEVYDQSAIDGLELLAEAEGGRR